MKLIKFVILCGLGLLVWMVFLHYNSDDTTTNEKSVEVTRKDNNSWDRLRVGFEKMRKHYNDTRETRLQLFRELHQGKTTFGWHWANLYNGLVPEVWCQSLVRIGAVSDGGKWMCNPWEMPKNCAIYSLGVNEDTSFERELQTITDARCKIYAYDKFNPSSTSVLDGMDKLNFHFKKALIGTVDDKAKKIVNVKSEMAAHGDERIEILKIDIEGAEFIVLRELVKVVKMCQILVEIHGRTGQQVVQLLNDLGKVGYRLFSYEINGKHHNLCEYSLIHDDCLQRYQMSPLAFYLNDTHT